MVCDFNDIKRVVSGWIDRELDHKMILRRDDPLLEPLRAQGEPVFVVDENPTAEHIAYVIFDHTRRDGLPVVRVTVWETPTSCATYVEDVGESHETTSVGTPTSTTANLNGRLVRAQRRESPWLVFPCFLGQGDPGLALEIRQ